MILDRRGRPLRCPTPRSYPDKWAPGGWRFERCRTNVCPTCLPEKVLTLINAMRLFPLTQSGVATLIDDTIDAAVGAKLLRTGVNSAFRFVASKTGILVPRASVVEMSDAGRVHENIVTRGSDVPSALFAEGCERAGLGYAALQPVITTEAISRYIFKTVLPAAGEAFVADPGAIEDFLLFNANRVVSTRGDFWIDTDGTVLVGAREARKAVYREALRGGRIRPGQFAKGGIR